MKVLKKGGKTKKKKGRSYKDLDAAEKEVYRRGLAAYMSSGNRPKVSQHAWAMGRKTTTSSSQYTLVDKADYSDDKAHKVYIKNTSTVATENAIITVESQLLGRLYAGDWCLLPYNGDQDIKITPSVATAFTIEFLVIYEA
jgi:hypothetical protein